MTASPGRSVDHVVMPVETLGSVRSLLVALGFTVAPDAAHPFGTSNACVFFADGTYLEPLAVTDRDLAETEGGSGNAFLRRDLAYRLRHPLPGFSAVALRSRDALADREAFDAAGCDGGDILEFGRRFERPGAPSAELRFRLAFAADRAIPETFVFACQRLTDFAPDSSALASHSNGVTALARIVYAAAEPERARRFLAAAFGAEPVVANSLGFSIAAGGIAIDVLGPDGMATRYGHAPATGNGLRIAGLVLRTPMLDRIRASALSAGLNVAELPGRLVVRLSTAGEAFLAFDRDAGAQ